MILKQQAGKISPVRSDLVPIDVPLLRFLMLQVPLAQQVPHHVRRGIIHPVEPLHTDALTGVPETLRIVAIVMGKLATFCVEFGQMCEFVVPALLTNEFNSGTLLENFTKKKLTNFCIELADANLFMDPQANAFLLRL